MRTLSALMMMMVTAAISGCSTLRPPMVYCEVSEPISWSTKDTAQTKEEVKAHNAVYEVLCGSGKNAG